MKALFAGFLIMLIAGCASPGKFAKGNKETGFVVFSTGFTDSCGDALNNANLALTPGDPDKSEVEVIIKNMIKSVDFEENNTIVHAFPAWAGLYAIDKVVIPKPFFAYVKDEFKIPQVSVDVKAGQIQYLGSFVFSDKKGLCSKGSFKTTYSATKFKTRDMDKAAEDHPEIFSASDSK